MFRTDGIGSPVAKSNKPPATKTILPHPHDIIPIFIQKTETVFQRTWPLFQSGMTLKEISLQTGVPKTSIRNAFVKKGVIQDGNPKKTKLARKNAERKTGGVARYGYCWLNGKLVLDPKEYKIVQLILKLSQKGRSVREISNHLNDSDYPTRHGKPWGASAVQSILKQEINNKPKEV